MAAPQRPRMDIYLDLGEFPSDYAAATSERRPEGNRWADILTKARLAESLGFDSVWIPDHLIFCDDEGRPEGFWECTSMLAALAAATERVEIGSLVACVPFRNPALLAKIAATIDEISGGRLILGLGAGYYEPEFEAFGYPFGRLASRFEEAIQIIHGLLRDGEIDFEGEYYSVRECELRPRGSRPDGPPLMIAARGPRMMKLAARYGDLWNEVFVNAEPDHLTRYRELGARLDTGCAEVGRDPSTLGRTVAVFLEATEGGGDRWQRNGQLVSGSPSALNGFIADLANEGVDQIIVIPSPQTPEGIEALASLARK